MKNFIIGLGIFLVGLTIWLATFMGWIDIKWYEGASDWFGDPIAGLGIGIMILGPLWFWVIMPIRRR